MDAKARAARSPMSTEKQQIPTDYRFFKWNFSALTHPDIADLIETSQETDLYKLICLVTMIAQANDDGRLTFDGKPYKLRHIARAMKCTPARCLEFLKRAHELDLICVPVEDEETECNVSETFHETGRNVSGRFTDVSRAFHETWEDEFDDLLRAGDLLIELCNYDYWYGVQRPKTSTARVQKYRQKKAEKAKKKADSKAKKKGGKSAAKDDETERNVSETRGNVSLNKQKQNKNKEKLKQKEKQQQDQEQPDGVVSFEEKCFLKAAGRAYQLLYGIDLPRNSQNFTLDNIRELTSGNYGWKDAEGAIQLAAQKLKHEMDTGKKKIDNPWGYLLTTPLVAEMMKMARNYNDVMEKKGCQLEYRWEPKEAVAK